MLNRIVGLSFSGIAVAVLTAALFAPGVQAQGRGEGGPAAKLARTLPVDKPFDAHNLAGVWTRSNTALGWGGGSTCWDCGDRGFSNDVPVFTAAGKKAFDANKPSYGRLLGSPDAAAHTEEDIGRRRAVSPANGTDPYQYCNPMGVTRALIYPDPIEFVQLPDRIYQHYMWGYGIRPIWLDGRKLPDDPDQARWWGYSVGHWDGDRLVVESTGHDERTWVDHFGYPHSEEMKLEERYRRTNYNTIELNWTITDPKYYTKPWVGQTKRFHLVTNIKTVDGWTGMLEDVCAPADEVDNFDKRVRDLTGPGK